MNAAATSSRVLLPVLAVFVAVLGFLALQDSALVLSGGFFEYPLDDPYIHLAMAEQMAQGGYGVNPGEYAAASSSPQFPVLLLPFAGTDWQRYLPLIWNAVGLIVSAWLWGRTLWQAGLGASVIGLFAAAIGPIALNMMGVSFTGMEHSLHVAASLAIILGLIGFLDTGRVGKLLIIGIVLAPLMRFEGLALALAATLLVLWNGPRVTAMILIALAVLPTAAFMAFLTQLGLDPLPSSVSAKLAVPGGAHTGSLAYFSKKLATLAAHKPAFVLAGFLLIAMALHFSKAVRAHRRMPLALVILAAGVAHFLLGRFGWMDRYEIYILATVAAGCFALATIAGTRWVLLPLLLTIFAGSIYLPLVANIYPTAPRALVAQQLQMSRLAQNHLAESVAVSDLGRVSWRNPNHVLDLWGLADKDALRLRLNATEPGWPVERVKGSGVNIAIVYDELFADHVKEDWVLLAQLRTDILAYYLDSSLVNIYLTNPSKPTEPYIEKSKPGALICPVVRY